MKLSIISMLVIALGFFTIAEAKVYTWIDASGEKHYSGTPPKPNEKISNLKDNLRIVDNKFTATKIKKVTKLLAKKVKPERMNGSDNKDKVKKSTKRKLCRSQRKKLNMLKRYRKANWALGSKSKRLNNKQRQDRIRILKESIRMYCLFTKEQRDREPMDREKQQEQEND